MKQRHIIHITWSCVLLTLLGCGEGEKVDDRQALLDTLTNDLLIPKHEDFAEKSALMARAIEAYCMAPSEEGFEAAREAWFEARGSWKKREVFNFGPYKEFPEFLGPLIDFWPVREEKVLEHLEGDTSLSADSLASYGSTRRGFPALEYLMFGPDEEIEANVTPERRCDYMIGAANDIENLADQMLDAWIRPDGYAAQLRDPLGSPESMYMDVQEALSEPVNRMWFTVENIRRDKLGRPAGDSTGGTPQPKRVESFYGGRSRQDLIDSLITLDEMFEIEGGIAQHPRMLERPDVIEDFRTNLAAAITSLEALDDPLSQEVFDDSDAVREALTTMSSLQRTIQVDMINVLSLNINFNDADGD